MRDIIRPGKYFCFHLVGRFSKNPPPASAYARIGSREKSESKERQERERKREKEDSVAQYPPIMIYQSAIYGAADIKRAFSPPFPCSTLLILRRCRRDRENMITFCRRI